MLKNLWLEAAPSTDALLRVIPRLLPFLMIAGLAIAAFGQYTLSSDFPRFSTEGPIYMAIGGALFLAALILRGQSLEADNVLLEEESRGLSAASSFRWGWRQTVAVGLGLLGGVIGYTQNDNNTFTLSGVVPWLLGGLALVWGFWQPRWPVSWNLRYLKSDFSWVWLALALALTMALAAFFRFYQLGDLPGNMTGDHARNLFDIRDVWERGFHPVYFIGNNGREPFLFYIIAPLASILGYSFLSLKIGTAVVGVISVFMAYLMARELFDNKKVALLAAVLFSLSFLHLIESRGGFRAILGGLAFSITLIYLFRALKFNRTHDFVFSGLALGAGLLTYSAMRVVPAAVGLVLVVALLDLLLTNRREAPVFLANALLLVLASLVMFAPLARFVVDDQDTFFSRAAELSEPPWESDTPLATLGANLKDTALMFNWTSEVWPATATPYLDYVTGAFFVLGLPVMLIGWALWRKRLWGYAVLIFLVVLIPSYVKREADLANALRMDFVAPLVIAFAAVPLYLAAEQIAKVVGKRWPIIVLPALAATVALIGFVNHQLYFDDWAQRHSVHVGNQNEVGSAMRDFVASGGSLENAYFKTWPFWLDGLALGIEIGDLDWQGFVQDIEKAKVHAANPQAKIYVFYHQDEDTRLRLREIYPEGTLRRVHSEFDSPGKDFFIFQVPAKLTASDKDRLIPTRLDERDPQPLRVYRSKGG